MEIMNDTNLIQDDNLHQKILVHHKQILILMGVGQDNEKVKLCQSYRVQLQRNQVKHEKDLLFQRNVFLLIYDRIFCKRFLEYEDSY